MTRPNGIAFSPDERRLYVAQSDSSAAIWRVFDVKADGTIENSRVLFDATSLAKTRRGLPDGLKIDTDGNLFATGPGGVLVISPRGQAPRHDPDRSGDQQLRVRRRRPDALHDRRRLPDAGEAQGEGNGVLTPGRDARRRGSQGARAT